MPGSIQQLLLHTKVSTYTYIATNLTLGLLGLLLNTTIASYYLRKSRRGRTVPFLYTVISLSNLITCSLALCHAMVLLLDIEGQDAVNRPKLGLILACYLGYCTITRASICHNLVLSVLRSINIARPFYRTRWQNILVVLTVFYTLRLIYIFDIVDVSPLDGFNNRFVVEQMFRMPMPGEGLYYYVAARVNSSSALNGEIFNVHHMTLTTMALTLVLPCYLMLLTSLHQCYMILHKQRTMALYTSQLQSKQSALTGTILAITVLCVLCNTAYATLFFYYTANTLGVGYASYTASLTYAFSTCVYTLNSVVEPLVFLARGSSIRTHLRKVLWRRVSSTKKTGEIELKDIKSC